MIVFISGQLGICKFFFCDWPQDNSGDLVPNSKDRSCTKEDSEQACPQIVSGSQCVEKNSQYQCVCKYPEKEYYGHCVPEIYCKCK